MRHRLEAYTPKEKRIYGYFAMPVLDGTRIVGLVDPGRRGEVLVAKQVTLLRPGRGSAGGAGACGSGLVGRLARRARSSGWSRRRPVRAVRAEVTTALAELSRPDGVSYEAARSAIFSNVLMSPP